MLHVDIWLTFWNLIMFQQVAPYCASKWAVEGLSRSVAKELPSGLAIVALNPGVINTDMLMSCFGGSAALYQTPEAWYHPFFFFFLCSICFSTFSYLFCLLFTNIQLKQDFMHTYQMKEKHDDIELEYTWFLQKKCIKTDQSLSWEIWEGICLKISDKSEAWYQNELISNNWF